MMIKDMKPSDLQDAMNTLLEKCTEVGDMMVTFHRKAFTLRHRVYKEFFFSSEKNVEDLIEDAFQSINLK